MFAMKSTTTKVQPETLPVGEHLCRFSQNGSVNRIRVYQGVTGHIVQFWDEMEGWLCPFYPAHPALPVFLVADDSEFGPLLTKRCRPTG